MIQHEKMRRIREDMQTNNEIIDSKISMINETMKVVTTNLAIVQRLCQIKDNYNSELATHTTSFHQEHLDCTHQSSSNNQDSFEDCEFFF